jgi:hypothetical protein
MRKFYPWYLERLGTDQDGAATLQASDELGRARRLVSELAEPVAAPA